jgi:transcription antitermination factor NusG
LRHTMLGPTMRELCPAEPCTVSVKTWYALTVKHQHEQVVRSALEFKGFEALVPTYRVTKRWSDRVKELDVPLFSGYVFCRLSVGIEALGQGNDALGQGIDDRALVLNTPSVSRVVGFGGVPAAISEAEIQAIQKAMAAGIALRPWPHLKSGDRVRVERGPLRGVEGLFLRDGAGHQLVIAVALLQRSVAVTMDADTVAPIAVAPVKTAGLGGAGMA